MANLSRSCAQSAPPSRWRVEIFHDYDKDWTTYDHFRTRAGARKAQIDLIVGDLQSDPQGYTNARVVDTHKGKST